MFRRYSAILLFLYFIVIKTATGEENDTESLVELEPLIAANPGWQQGSECICYNSTETERLHRLEVEPECRCRGFAFAEIPSNISSYMRRLTVDEAGIEMLKKRSLAPYRNILREITLMNVNNFHTIEPEAFSGLTELRTIYIYRAPELKEISPAVFQENLPKLKILRIVHTGLQKIPNLNQLKKNNIFHMIDLENNQIYRIETGSFRIKAEQLLLNYNHIQEVQSKAFEGSQVARLSLKGNRALTFIHPEAFVGLNSLRELDLSKTSIIQLPTKGLQELEILRLQNTYTLKVFPSIYNFEYIKEAWLTYPYHCCAFQFPSTHDPAEYARHQKFVDMMQKNCSQTNTTESSYAHRLKRMDQPDGPPFPSDTGWGGLHVEEQDTFSTPKTHGVFLQEDVTLSPVHAICGELSKNYRDVKCFPEPDAFNPCEDIMGNWALRCAVWLVAVSALVGNLAVLLVLISSRFRMTVPKFLMCNLALADFCMGLYLLLIAVMDAKSIGVYFNHAIDWQRGTGCQVSGFLTVFASELSIFTLTVITCERWYTITYAIHLNKRLKLSTARKIMIIGWLYSIMMASLPLLGVSGYYKTSICLPMENHDITDIAYLAILLTFNGMAFWIICICYGRMYYSIRDGQDGIGTAARSDMTVAKRMALLVFTDFACWAPIAFFGLTALSGYPLIDVPHTKILLVFFYPLNSCANPYLYALLTQQYRRDFFILLSRYGLCSDRAARYKGTTGSYPRGVGMVGTGGSRNTGTQVTGCGTPHRGSLLTTLTSIESVNPSPGSRPGSLTAIPEIKPNIESRRSTIELSVLGDSVVCNDPAGFKTQSSPDKGQGNGATINTSLL